MAYYLTIESFQLVFSGLPATPNVTALITGHIPFCSLLLALNLARLLLLLGLGDLGSVGRPLLYSRSNRCLRRVFATSWPGWETREFQGQATFSSISKSLKRCLNQTVISIPLERSFPTFGRQVCSFKLLPSCGWIKKKRK